MVDGVKGCTEVEEDEDGEGTFVSRAEDVICNFEECGFGAVT